MSELEMLRRMFDQNVTLAGELLALGDFDLAKSHLRAAGVQVDQIADCGKTTKEKELIEV